MRTFSAAILIFLCSMTLLSTPGYAIGRFYKWMEKAKEGDPKAMYEVGLSYERGSGTRVDYRKARNWYEQAIDKNYAPAMVRLGWLYQDGARGVRRNAQKALELYEMAADLGEAQAMVNMAVMYDQGQLVPPDDSAALLWYTKAAELGHPVALYNLGITYWQGSDGVKQDYREAWRLLNQLRTSETAEAADKTEAQHRLDDIKMELGIKDRDGQYPSWEELGVTLEEEKDE